LDKKINNFGISGLDQVLHHLFFALKSFINWQIHY